MADPEFQFDAGTTCTQTPIDHFTGVCSRSQIDGTLWSNNRDIQHLLCSLRRQSLGDSVSLIKSNRTRIGSAAKSRSNCLNVF